jgi:hypothetical protein
VDQVEIHLDLADTGQASRLRVVNTGDRTVELKFGRGSYSPGVNHTYELSVDEAAQLRDALGEFLRHALPPPPRTYKPGVE